MSAPADSCSGDLIVLARRAGAESPEWDALRTHARACDECGVTWLTMQWFDGAGAVRPGDERLVGRAVEATLAKRRARAGSTRPRSRRPALAVAASLILAGAMASAGIALRRHWQPAPVGGSAGGTTSAGSSIGHRRIRVGPAPQTPPATPEPSAPARVPMTDPEPAPAPHLGPPPQTARKIAALSRDDVLPPAAPRARSRQADLFARATVARRDGRTVEAIALFRRLESETPQTPEAVVALVALGQLLGETGEVEAALATFDSYLRQSPTGPLVPEALAARAGMLARLGRATEARACREELERRFPGSPYGTRPKPSPGGNQR
jgi:hypothetical protein